MLRNHSGGIGQREERFGDAPLQRLRQGQRYQHGTEKDEQSDRTIESQPFK